MITTVTPDRPLLTDVTLVAATSVAVRQTVAALEKSLREVTFAKAMIFTDHPPLAGTDSAITWRPIERIGSRADFSRFMLRELPKHIETGHALCVQWDGYVLDGRAWDSRFLDFDYVGAVWPQFHDRYNVGNGGFSLRSRRLLAACVDLPLGDCEAEDIIIARICRDQLEQQGIRFAPESVARRFAYERELPTGHEFGFHGAFNLVRYLPPVAAYRLFRSLEPEMLTRRERIELLRWALAHRYFKLAIAMIARLT